MNWNSRNRLSSHLRSSLWVVPLSAVLLHLVVSKAIHLLDARLGWAGANYGVDGAKALCNTVISLTLSFIVFTFASLLVAIQVASGQYTPRIIATTLLRDNVIRYTVGLFVFTFLFGIRDLGRTESTVHQFVAIVAGFLALSCIVAFLFLIDYAARMLRPISLVRRVGQDGLAVMES